ncbi:MAG: Uma2 family endonuclease [Isosphaeraceae bacterium]
MATATIKSIREHGGDQGVEIRDMDWKGYSTLLRLRRDRSAPRIVYLDGSAWIMSPSLSHERLGERMGQFVVEVVVGIKVPCRIVGSTTFRRKPKRGGIEPDKAFYLANEKRVRGKTKLNLRTDTPPDLAIEAVYSHDADAAIEVYRRLKVPEVWVCDESELVIPILQPSGRYAPSASSAAFPFLAAAEIHDWVSRPETDSDMEWVTELRTWVKDTLVRRASATGANAAGPLSQQTDSDQRKES